MFLNPPITIMSDAVQLGNQFSFPPWFVCLEGIVNLLCGHIKGFLMMMCLFAGCLRDWYNTGHHTIEFFNPFLNSPLILPRLFLYSVVFLFNNFHDIPDCEVVMFVKRRLSRTPSDMANVFLVFQADSFLVFVRCFHVDSTTLAVSNSRFRRLVCSPLPS